MMKQALGMVLVFLAASQVMAKVSVSPVVIEETMVKEGQGFTISCRNWGDDWVELELSLALFDWDKEGGVRFLEDGFSVAQAEQYLRLERTRLILGPKEQAAAKVEVTADNFEELNAVLFIQANRGPVPVRLAVLLLLTAQEGKGLALSSWTKYGQALLLEAGDLGELRSVWEGELHLCNGSRFCRRRLVLQSGLVVPELREPEWERLPSWVRRVEVHQVRAESRV